MAKEHNLTTRVRGWRRTAGKTLGLNIAGGRTEYELDAADAELLEDGSLIFAGDQIRVRPPEKMEWWIFARPGSRRGEAPAVFTLRGTVPAERTAEEFVCGAYSFVLGRAVDAEGRRGFTELLESGQHTRPDVLKFLITSVEARKKDDQFVIVPKPSRWLPKEASAVSDVTAIKIIIQRPLPARENRSPLQLYPGYGYEDLAIFEEFRNQAAKAQQGYIVDFLGGRIRISSVAHASRHLDGQLLGIPVPSDYHAEAIEWIGLLKSVKTARDDYAAMELGAGFGPWSIAGALAARQRGISRIRLCAVEADPQHFQFLRQNYSDNGFDPDEHTLIEAAVGGTAGVARWPAFTDSSDDWGSRPLMPQSIEESVAQDYLGRTFSNTIEVNIVPISDLLRREPLWNLVHIDVQGTEVDLIRAGIDDFNARVHWMVIGTHSRKLEGDLIEILFREGWMLEHEKPAKFKFRPDSPTLEAMTNLDGTQVWLNPRKAPA